MTDTDTQRYNLVFAGQVLPGTDQARARRTLAAFFGLKDPASVQVFFSGKPVPLRRNLSHQEALRLYRQLRSVGLICDIPRAEGGPTPDKASSSATGRGTARPRPELGQAARGGRTGSAGSQRQSDRDASSGGIAKSRLPYGSRSAPNLFALRPALLQGKLEALREQNQIRAIIAAGIGVVLCIVVAAVNLRFPPPDLGPEPYGPLAATEISNGQLIMLLPDALLVHARSGLERERIEAAALGLEELLPPLRETSDGTLLLRGRTAAGTLLLSCRLSERVCQPFAPDLEPGATFGFAESYLGETRFVLMETGRLLRLSAAGDVEAEALITDAKAPLLYRDGLLLIPQRESPFVGVFRPDVSTFGAQIDALLLTPTLAPGDEPEEAPGRILDVAAIEENYYVIMAMPSGGRALYRFDMNWGAGTRIELPTPPADGVYLVPWRDRLLLADPAQAPMQRLAPGGTVEAGFTSPMLEQARSDWNQKRRERQLLERLGLILPLTLACLAFLSALLYLSTQAALMRIPRISTGLLDPLPGGIEWRASFPEARPAAHRIGNLFVIASIAPGLIIAGTGGSYATLCLAPALVAALYARRLLGLGCGGHVGRVRKEVIVIDYDGRYFYGRPAALRRGLGFLFSAGVALPLSAGGIRNINTQGLDGVSGASLPPLAALGQLWQLRHPWALASVSIATGTILSAALWLLFSA